LARRAGAGTFRWKPVTFKGNGLSVEFADSGWASIRGAIYPEPGSNP
jgi:hypothetical protein